MRTRLLILVLVAVACLAAKPLPVVFQKSGPAEDGEPGASRRAAGQSIQHSLFVEFT